VPDSTSLLRRAADLCRARATKARAEVLDNDYFGRDLTNYSKGIDNACGGEAGKLASLLTPDGADALAEVLDEAADQWSEYARETDAASANVQLASALDLAGVLLGEDR